MEINKVKNSLKGEIQITYQDKDKQVLTSEDLALSEFYEAIQSFLPFAVELNDLGESWTESGTVYSVSLKHSEGIGCTIAVGNSSNNANSVTPFISPDNVSSELKEAINRLSESAIAYIKGDRAQVQQELLKDDWHENS